MKKIAEFYLKILLINSKFNSSQPNSNQELLFPDFLLKLNDCINQYTNLYPNQEVTFAETYRSNVLQEIYYNNGASKIKKNGMHHYGIAADSIFIISGKRTYKGDINALRKVYKDNGLTILGMWDPLHVQYIPVADQQLLRNATVKLVKTFQTDNGLEITGEANLATIAKAKDLYGV
jgi:hypothetical protein